MTDAPARPQARQIIDQDRIISESQTTVRNAGLLLVQRGVQILSSLAFAALVPRLMGPDAYGRYAMMSALLLWFVLCSSMGFVQIISRYVPEFAAQEKRERIPTFLGRLLIVRLASSAVAAFLYFFLSAVWLRELDRVALGLVAGAVFARAVANFFFAIFLGLNRAARWAMQEVIRGWGLVVLLSLGFQVGGLRGACWGLLLTEMLVLLIGLRWARSHISWSLHKLDLRGLAPYLRFGMAFSASALLLSASGRSGAPMIRVVSQDYSQISYFGIAYGVYLALDMAFRGLKMAFVPLLTSLRTRGRIDLLRQWIELLLKGLTSGAMVALLGLVFLGETLVPWVFGAAYQPVLLNLFPMLLTLLVTALSKMASLLALVYDRPRTALAAAGVRLAALWVLGLPLTAWQGSLGACLAVLGSTMLYALVFTLRMSRVLRYSVKVWVLATTLGVPFLALGYLLSALEVPAGFPAWIVNVSLYAAATAGYLGTLFLFRIITVQEAATLWQAIVSKRQLPSTRSPSGAR